MGRGSVTGAEPLRVLLVNDYGTPTGGAEVQMLGLREGLRRRGHDARLLASSADDGTGANAADYRCFGTTTPFRTVLQTVNPLAYLRLRRVLRDFRPDVVHVRIFLTQLSPLILPLLRDVPTVYHVAWYRPVCPLGTKLLPDGSACTVRAGRACLRDGCLPIHYWLLQMVQRRLFRRWWSAFDRIVAVSGSVRDELALDGIEPVQVMWNAVPARPARPPLTRPPTVAFAGRLVREKGADVLLRAFRAVLDDVPDARLIVAGDGPERRRLERLAGELGLEPHVSILGHLSRAEAERRFATAWVQCVPSRWAEPFGIVAAEGMMRGTAVVATRSGGLAEIVRDEETGLLVPPDEPIALADALRRILSDRGLAEAMGLRGREHALASLGPEAYLDRLLELYSDLVGSGPRKHAVPPRTGVPAGSSL